jgi:glutamate synthase (ferredoxin)
MVDSEELTDADEIAEVKELIQKHFEHTSSAKAWNILCSFQSYLPKFVKLIPRDYRRVLQAIEHAKAMGFTGEEALMQGFEMNKNDMARVSGN